MKTRILPIIILSLLFGGVVFAQESELPEAGLTPDSPFYFLERIAEGIGTFFTFGDIKKAERYTVLAAERLAEAKVMAEKGKPEFVEKILEKYENQLEKAVSRIEKAKTKGKNTKEVTNIISEATQKHITVLERVLEKVPEQAKPAIEQAMEVSNSGGKRAVEAESLGQEVDAIIAKCVEMGGPSQVCDSIEEALSSTKPMKTLCLEHGGTQEMCEVMPSKNFKSFKQIRDFCTEQGGPAEICETLESICKEQLGITKADTCFRVMSISSVTTFQSAEIKAVPARALSEKEICLREGGPPEMCEKLPSSVLSEEEVQQERVQTPLKEKQTTSGKKLKQRYVPNVSKVTIYSTPTCPHCAKAKEWFEQRDIQYEEIDISQNKIKQDELMEKVGQLAVPIIEVEDDTMAGFNEERFSTLFGIE